MLSLISYLAENISDIPLKFVMLQMEVMI